MNADNVQELLAELADIKIDIKSLQAREKQIIEKLKPVVDVVGKVQLKNDTVTLSVSKKVNYKVIGDLPDKYFKTYEVKRVDNKAVEADKDELIKLELVQAVESVTTRLLEKKK